MFSTFHRFLKPQQTYFYSLTKKFKFLRTTKPLLNTFDVDELPDQESTEIGMRLESKRTYTKWFNPNQFDPRSPDYFETVRGDWRSDPTREDFGEGI